MRRVVVTNNITLDGVMQSPASREEDPRDGFPHGGWAVPYNDAVMLQEMMAGMSRPGDLLFGRRTYQQFHSVWPHRTNNPYTEVLNRTRKYVVSRTLRDPLPWENSTLLSGEAAETVGALKQDGDRDLGILGSGELVRSLLKAGLVDQMVLLIYPMVLGTGRRMFGDDGAFAKFRLTKSVPTTKGAIIATYELDA